MVAGPFNLTASSCGPVLLRQKEQNFRSTEFFLVALIVAYILCDKFSPILQYDGPLKYLHLRVPRLGEKPYVVLPARELSYGL